MNRHRQNRLIFGPHTQVSGTLQQTVTKTGL